MYFGNDTYGGVDEASLFRILESLQEFPGEYALGEKSRVLCVGQSLDWAVFHTRLATSAEEIVGIDKDHGKINFATQVMEGYIKCHMDMRGVNFICKDLGKLRQYNYTHVYAFDKDFKDWTREAREGIFNGVTRSSATRVVVTFTEESLFKKSPIWSQVKEIDIRTGDRQSMKAYIFVKKNDNSTADVMRFENEESNDDRVQVNTRRMKVVCLLYILLYIIIVGGWGGRVREKGLERGKGSEKKVDGRGWGGGGECPN